MISDDTTKLPSSNRYSIGTKTDTQTSGTEEGAQEQSPVYVVKSSTSQAARVHDREKMACSTGAVGETGQLHAKGSKWIIFLHKNRLNARPETIKLLEGNTSHKLFDIENDSDISGQRPEAKAMNQKSKGGNVQDRKYSQSHCNKSVWWQEVTRFVMAITE